MNFRNLMLFTAGSTLLFGAGFVAAPALLGNLFGLVFSPAAELMARLYGAALVGIAVQAWLVRGSQDGAVQKPFLLMLLATDFGGFACLLLAQLAGLMNPLGWLVAGLLGLLCAAYAYLSFIKQPG